MNSKKYLVLILVLALTLPFASMASAEQERLEFTFTDVCDWDSMQIERVILAGPNNWLARGLTLTCREIETIPQYTGTAHLEFTLNELTKSGIFFWVGKGRMETDEGGIWNLNCVYHSVSSPDAQCVGKGEGIYEGKQVFLRVLGGVGGSGYIVDHGK